MLSEGIANTRVTAEAEEDSEQRPEGGIHTSREKVCGLRWSATSSRLKRGESKQRRKCWDDRLERIGSWGDDGLNTKQGEGQASKN